MLVIFILEYAIKTFVFKARKTRTLKTRWQFFYLLTLPLKYSTFELLLTYVPYLLGMVRLEHTIQ